MGKRQKNDRELWFDEWTDGCPVGMEMDKGRCREITRIGNWKRIYDKRARSKDSLRIKSLWQEQTNRGSSEGEYLRIIGAGKPMWKQTIGNFYVQHSRHNEFIPGNQFIFETLDGGIHSSYYDAFKHAESVMLTGRPRRMKFAIPQPHIY